VWVFQYKDSIGGGSTTPSLQDVATVGNYYINDFGDTLKLNSYDSNNKHPLLWVNDQYNPVNILDFSYNTGFNQNVASIKFGDSTNTLATGYIKITDKESYFRNELSERTIIQNTPSISSSNQVTYFPLMKGGTDTLATTADIRNSATNGTVTTGATGYGLSWGTITTSGTLLADTSVSGLSGKYLRIIDTTNKWVNSVSQPNDSTIRVIKNNTTSDFIIRSSVAGSATRLITQVYNNSGATIT